MAEGALRIFRRDRRAFRHRHRRVRTAAPRQNLSDLSILAMAAPGRSRQSKKNSAILAAARSVSPPSRLRSIFCFISRPADQARAPVDDVGAVLESLGEFAERRLEHAADKKANARLLNS